MRLLFVLLAVAARISPQTPVADDLLKKVAESYTNLKNYQFEVHVNRSVNSPGRYGSRQMLQIFWVDTTMRNHFSWRRPFYFEITK